MAIMPIEPAAREGTKSRRSAVCEGVHMHLDSGEQKEHTGLSSLRGSFEDEWSKLNERWIFSVRRGITIIKT